MAPIVESHLVLGGARSGKSRQAVALAQAVPGRVAFVATAIPADPDLRARIARHRAERPRDWLTVEEPFELASACRRLAGGADLVIVDCLTLWVSNSIERGMDDDRVLSAAGALAKLQRERLMSLVIVSNEVGEGVHPPTALGMRFRDLLGLVNQRVAAAADRVTLMVAGIAVDIKRAQPAPAALVVPSVGAQSRDRAPEAP